KASPCSVIDCSRRPFPGEHQATGRPRRGRGGAPRRECVAGRQPVRIAGTGPTRRTNTLNDPDGRPERPERPERPTRPDPTRESGAAGPYTPGQRPARNAVRISPAKGRSATRPGRPRPPPVARPQSRKRGEKEKRTRL
ncbi:MAG: hypothetical protein AUK64_2305, partial [bacterium P201]